MAYPCASLNAFPTEILASILDAAAAHAIPAALKLWACGNTLLNYKLQNGGCQTLILDNRVLPNRYRQLPKTYLTNAFRQLQSVTLHSKTPLPSCALDPLGPTLYHLSISCPNLAELVNCRDYATKWPQLQTLLLYHANTTKEPGDIDNLVPYLPPTLTRLAVPKLAKTSNLANDVLAKLPRDLMDLTYAMPQGIMMLLLLGHEADILKALPPNLRHFCIADNFSKTAYRLNHVENAPFLPRAIQTLEVNCNRSHDGHVSLPSRLGALKINMVYEDDLPACVQQFAPLPPCVTKLTFNQSAYRSITASSLLTIDQWMHFLPPRLVVFEGCDSPAFLSALPWKDMTKDQCIWPPTLQVITLRLLKASYLSSLVLPPSIKQVVLTVAQFDTNVCNVFTNLFTPTKTPHLTRLTLNFALNNTLIANLPTSLVYLNLMIDRDPSVLLGNTRDYRPLKNLQSLLLDVSDLHLKEDQQLLLPDSLTLLEGKSSRGPADFGTFTTRRLLQSFPSGLRSFVLSNMCIALTADILKLLPSHLETFITQFSFDNEVLINILRALPSSLTTLNLCLVNRVVCHPCLSIPYMRLKALLPPRIKSLTLGGMFVNQLEFDQPIASLQNVSILVPYKIHNSSKHFEQLFPNAHSITIK